MDMQLLEDIGLTKGETKVYLTLLKIGESTTGKIIKEAQISGGKVYLILDKLIKKGLVGYLMKEKTRFFYAASPNRILDFLHKKENEIKSKEQEIQKIIPSLISLTKSSEVKLEAALFKGYKGIQTAIREALDSLKPGDTVKAMGIETRRDEKYNIMWIRWHNERIKRKIKCEMIFSYDDKKYPSILSKMKLTQVRILRGITPSTVNIMDDRVLIFTYHEEPGCLSIKHKDIAKSFTTFFNSLWELSK